jgi:hypothetical protein
MPSKIRDAADWILSTFSEQSRIPLVELDVGLASCSSLEPDGMTDHEGDGLSLGLALPECVLQTSLRPVRFNSSPLERAGLVCLANTQGFLDLMIPQF